MLESLQPTLGKKVMKGKEKAPKSTPGSLKKKKKKKSLLKRKGERCKRMHQVLESLKELFHPNYSLNK